MISTYLVVTCSFSHMCSVFSVLSSCAAVIYQIKSSSVLSLPRPFLTYFIVIFLSRLSIVLQILLSDYVVSCVLEIIVVRW